MEICTGRVSRCSPTGELQTLPMQNLHTFFLALFLSVGKAGGTADKHLSVASPVFPISRGKEYPNPMGVRRKAAFRTSVRRKTPRMENR